MSDSISKPRIVFFDGPDSGQVRRHWMPQAMGQLLGVEPRVEWLLHQRAADYGLAPRLESVNFEPSGGMQMQRIDGEHLPRDWLQHRQFCQQLCRVLRQLHQIPCGDLPTLSLSARCQVLHGRLAQCAAARARVHENALREVMASSAELSLRPSNETVLVHGDLHRENVIVRAGYADWILIDWEYAHRGHDLEDLAGVLTEHPGSFEQLARGQGELAAVLRESSWSPAWEALQSAIRVRQLLNDLWSDLYEIAQNPAGMLA